MISLQSGHLLRDGGRGREPVHARHLDVEQRDVGPLAHRRCDHLVAAPDLRHDVEVVLEFEQRGQGGADERLVVGEQQPDHASTSARSAGFATVCGAATGTSARSWKPLWALVVVTVPP